MLISKNKLLPAAEPPVEKPLPTAEPERARDWTAELVAALEAREDIPAPIVHVAAPVVHVAAPVVNVTVPVPKEWIFTIERDLTGQMAGARAVARY